jgi:hypothetical protein
MSLVTLAAVCAPGVSPKPIHAFDWHQSGGDPLSLSLPGGRPGHSTMHDAFRAAQTAGTDGGTIHLDLAGLRTGSSLATAETVMPSSKIAIAVRLNAHSSSAARPCHSPGPIRSSVHSPPIAADGNAPAITSASAVIARVGKSDTPNFDMPNENSIGSARVGSRAPPARSRLLAQRPQFLRKIAIAVGRSHCFQRKSSGPTAGAPALKATIRVQIKRRLSTQQLRFRRQRSSQSRACW